MISSGMSLLRALYVLEEQTENDKLKEAWARVRKDVEAGISLSDALAQATPTIFNELYVAMVAAGETGGILEETLLRVADQLEKDDALRRQVKAAMVYPIADRAASRRSCCSRSSPSSCRCSRRSSRTSAASCRRSPSSRSRCPHLVTGQLVPHDRRRRRAWSTPSGAGSTASAARMQWDRFKLKVPFKIGDIVQKVALARFSRTFSAPDRRRRADARGDRDHRPHLRQQGDREGDGRACATPSSAAARSPRRCARCPRPSR